jgi:hypothetical protein
MHIDTLDFGIFDPNVNPVKDSSIFIFNKGAESVVVTSQNILGTNATDFSLIKTTILSVPVTPPYAIPPSIQTFAEAIITFTPQGSNGIRIAELHLKTRTSERVVILKAEVRSVLKTSVTTAIFDTAFLCLDQVRNIIISNPNEFPVTVTSVSFAGVNAADFNVASQIPLIVDSHSKSEIQVRFAPTVGGLHSATARLAFDLPQGYTETLPLSAYGEQLHAEFSARNATHILGGEDVLFPIYAKFPLEQFKSQGFVLTLDYDHSHLDAYDIVQENTLTTSGAYSVNVDTAGYNNFSYQTLDGSNISGGGPGERIPIIYVKFRSHLNSGDNPLLFHQAYNINYDFHFDHNPSTSDCFAIAASPGSIILDSSCEKVYLLHDTTLFSSESFIDAVYPNPIINSHLNITFNVPHEDVVKLDIVDVSGKTVSNIFEGNFKPGRYHIAWNISTLNSGIYYIRLQASEQVKTQQIMVIK